ncbi:MAG: site-2 protease family protein [Oscillospiraceae bacterium]|nr:site-2 protease family protein [Oscillospiraceae bacterium]
METVMSVLNVIAPIALAVLIFCIIILIHEIGHFSAARLFKMKVYDFSLGMGPTILKKRGKKTNYNIKLIPFGGSVQLGEDFESDDPADFRNKPVWQRMIVMLAGAFMNLVLGFILCVIIVAIGKSVDTTIVREVRTDSLPSRQLQAGDKITHINNMRVFTIADISYQLYNTESKMSGDADKAVFDFIIIRNGEKKHLNNVEFEARAIESGGMEIVLDFAILREEKTFFNIFSGAAKETVSYSRLIILTLVDMVRGTYGLNDIAGPVGVVSAIGEVSSTGFAKSIIDGIKNSLFMAALITINVGIFNLLPVPALDGSRFLFFVIEAIRRKPIKAEIEGMIHFVGFALLMGFMLLVTVFDIRKLFQ